MPGLTRSRLTAAVQRHGPAGLAAMVARRLRSLAYLDEDHVWYILDLGELEPIELAAGYTLQRGDEGSELEPAEELEGFLAATARERMAAGNELWLVSSDDGEPAFACFIFFGSTPVRASATRALELPAGVACLEDSVTSAQHRGRGIAGAAWTAIGEQLKANGIGVLITKVEVENIPSRKAVEKAGFLPAGIMHLRRRGVRERVAIEREPTQLSSAGEATAEALELSLAR